MSSSWLYKEHFSISQSPDAGVADAVIPACLPSACWPVVVEVEPVPAFLELSVDVAVAEDRFNIEADEGIVCSASGTLSPERWKFYY